jgi:2-iminobutanoate/2-iminopropanoate deaminase
MAKKIEIRYPEKAVSTGAYSAGTLPGGLLFISSQGPLNLDTGEVIRFSIEEETLLTLPHRRKNAEAAGSTINDILQCTVHLGDSSNFDRFNKAYAPFFTGIRPARTSVESVLSNNIKIEIDTIARISDY